MPHEACPSLYVLQLWTLVVARQLKNVGSAIQVRGAPTLTRKVTFYAASKGLFLNGSYVSITYFYLILNTWKENAKFRKQKRRMHAFL